ncbi:MAG: crotonase/enoyl-CoA hydratase family protein [Pseudomonadota bacterium]
MTYSSILYIVDDGILTISLNRPQRMNAFTVEMANELVDAFGRASEDDLVRAIIVTGSGRAFCAGMELGEPGQEGNVFGLNESLRPTMRDLDERLEDPDIVDGVRDTGGRVVLAIFDCKKPVIAAINGAAVGVGATMTLAMDVRIASEHARFGFVFGKIGIVPDACSSWFLPRVVGLPKALEWSYSAEIINAQEALRTNLVKDVVAAGDLLPAAIGLARHFSTARSPVSVALIRQMMYRNAMAPHPLLAHKVESLGVFYASMADGKEGVAAFHDKREPMFDGKASEMPPFYPWWK